MFVGRHEPRKGLGVLLDAFAGLDRDAELWVIGDGPHHERFPRHSPGGGPGRRVARAGVRRREGGPAAGATVACFPALDGESFGVVLLEAMAAGTAVVASDIDGYRTVSRPDREAILVPPGDADALRGALRRLLDDPAAGNAGGRRAGRRADEFSMTHLAERFLPLYERAIPNGRGRASCPAKISGGRVAAWSP